MAHRRFCILLIKPGMGIPKIHGPLFYRPPIREFDSPAIFAAFSFWSGLEGKVLPTPIPRVVPANYMKHNKFLKIS